MLAANVVIVALIGQGNREMKRLDGKLKNSTLKVLTDLPEGVSQRDFLGLKEASGDVSGAYKSYYYCENCGGWIEGLVHHYRVNNWAPHALAGRMGSVYECRRCGDELQFLGVMS